MSPARNADTREKMLEVAESRFAQRGYDGAHLESIAREVGVRKTALYHYFESKEALYIAVLERMLGAFDRTVSAVLESRVPRVEQAIRLSDAINDLLAEHPNYSQVLIRIFVDRIPVKGARLAPIIDRVVGDVIRWHHEGVEEGVFRPISSRHYFTSVLGMAIFHYAGGDFTTAVMGRDIFTRSAVAWRREEFKRLLLPGVLVDASAWEGLEAKG